MPGLRKVETAPCKRTYTRAPVVVRKHPLTFCLTLAGRKSRSAWLFWKYGDQQSGIAVPLKFLSIEASLFSAAPSFNASSSVEGIAIDILKPLTDLFKRYFMVNGYRYPILFVK
jgi:hypothetical protein